MQRMRRFISEQRVDLRLTVEITAEKVAEISQALNKNEQARLWAYFAKWKCWRYRRLLHDISMESYMLEAEDDSERLEEEDIPF